MTQSQAWEWGQRIRGQAVVDEVIPRLVRDYAAQIQDHLDHKVVILQFEKPPVSGFPSVREQQMITQYYAANDSTRAKMATFRRMGIQVEANQNLPWNTSESEFEQIIQSLVDDQNVRAFIVQNPMPPTLLDLLKRKDLGGKDIDAQSETSPFPEPATSSAINRVLEPSLDSDTKLAVESAARALETALDRNRSLSPLKVAIIGSSGKIGKPILQYVENHPHADAIPIEEGDMAFEQKIEQADMIVSTAGRPGLLTEAIVKPHHQLIIDCG